MWTDSGFSRQLLLLGVIVEKRDDPEGARAAVTVVGRGRPGGVTG